MAAGGLYIHHSVMRNSHKFKEQLKVVKSLVLVLYVLYVYFLQNGNSEDPNCVGIEEVLEAYFQSLRKVQLYGPTNFAPVINQVAR